MAIKVVKEVQSVYGKKKWKKAVIKGDFFPSVAYTVYMLQVKSGLRLDQYSM